MKSIFRILAPLAVVIALATGCASFPTANRSITYPASVPQGDVIEMAIDTGRELQFPPATKIDKAGGIVEFGAFGTPIVGLTAQVRIKSPGTIDLTVTHGGDNFLHHGGSMSADDAGNQFKMKLEAKLTAAGK